MPAKPQAPAFPPALGALGITTSLTPDRIRGTPCLKLAEGKDLRTVWLCFDQSRTELRSSDVKGKNPIKDKRVRRAIYQAIDLEEIHKDVMRGLALPAGMLVGPVRRYGARSEAALRPDAAKRLLAEAGYAEGFR